jgi:hypothetical protein
MEREYKKIAMNKEKTTVLILTLISILFSSCIIDLDSDYEHFNHSSEPTISFNNVWADRNINTGSTIIIGNDTLKITKLQYLISNLNLVSDIDTIQIADYRLMKSNRSQSLGFQLDSIPPNDYKLCFTFGLSNVTENYQDLNAQNFNTTEGGYYFMQFTMEQHSQNLLQIFNYHIAKRTPTTNAVNSFKVVIDNFEIGNSNSNNNAKINMNLNNLFSTPNSISLDELNQFVIEDSIVQTKMIENAKNIFYLDQIN